MGNSLWLRRKLGEMKKCNKIKVGEKATAASEEGCEARLFSLYLLLVDVLQLSSWEGPVAE